MHSDDGGPGWVWNLLSSWEPGNRWYKNPSLCHGTTEIAWFCSRSYISVVKKSISFWEERFDSDAHERRRDGAKLKWLAQFQYPVYPLWQCADGMPLLLKMSQSTCWQLCGSFYKGLICCCGPLCRQTAHKWKTSPWGARREKKETVVHEQITAFPAALLAVGESQSKSESENVLILLQISLAESALRGSDRAMVLLSFDKPWF